VEYFRSPFQTRRHAMKRRRRPHLLAGSMANHLYDYICI
jgi:hypothetical protein